MAIPDYQTIMLPLLKFAGDGEEHSLKSATDALADSFGLSETERVLARRERDGTG
jgi:restriction system protein